MNIKAQGLLNATTWIEETYGRDSLREVIRACSPELRDRYTSAISINWHPMSELVEFLAIADRILGKGDGRVAELVGEAGARVNLRGTMVSVVFYAGKPEFLLKRIAGLWRQFNDMGTMTVAEFSPRRVLLEVKGVDTPAWLFCCTLTGWAREVVRRLGGENQITKHVECRARGGARCLWELRWSGTSALEAATSGSLILPADKKP